MMSGVKGNLGFACVSPELGFHTHLIYILRHCRRSDNSSIQESPWRKFKSKKVLGERTVDGLPH